MLSHFSQVWLFVTAWTVACQAPLSMGHSRQEYWSGLLCPPPGDLPKSGIEPRSPSTANGFFPTEPPGKPQTHICVYKHTSLHFLCAAAAKSRKSCPTLCDPIDGSPPDSAVPGILQARTLEWVAISFSNAWKCKVKVKSLSHVQIKTPWTEAYQAPPSMGFSRQEYWSGWPLPSPTFFV